MTPTHFSVLYDDTNRLPDHIANLAYRLCFLYYNWTGSIRVPVPVKLAHKYAFFLGELGVHKGQKVDVHESYTTSRGQFYI